MNKIKYLIGLIIVALLFFILVPFVFAKNYPQHKGYVNDFADVLSQEYEAQLETKLREYEEKTTIEIAVVTVKSLNGESVEEYTINLAEEWKVGKAKEDNGVIFLTAINDRKTRIEVGYGNEEKLTDIESGRILDNITPYYKEGKYEEGIGAGVNGIVEQLSNDQILDGVATASAETTNVDGNGLILLILLLILGVPLFLILLAYSPYTEFGGSGAWGIGSSSGGSSGDGFGGFGGGSFGGGGASRGW